MNSVRKATRSKPYLSMETITPICGIVQRDSLRGYVDPLDAPRLASHMTRLLDLDVTRGRDSILGSERLTKVFVVADDGPLFPRVGIACHPIDMPSARRSRVPALEVNTAGYHLPLILNRVHAGSLLMLLTGAVRFELVDAPTGLIVVLRLAHLMSVVVPIGVASGVPDPVLPEPGTAQDTGVMLSFVDRLTGRQCFARFVGLRPAFMQRVREGFEHARLRPPAATTALLRWKQRHQASIKDAQLISDYRVAGRDCPVQALWTPTGESREVLP